jgi:hypothetical protein
MGDQAKILIAEDNFFGLHTERARRIQVHGHSFGMISKAYAQRFYPGKVGI